VSLGAWKQLINLPIGPDLRDEQVASVIAATLDAVRANRKGAA
jgi:hypothetical protein